MAVGILFEGGGFTKEQYEQLNEQMFGTPQPDIAIEGLIVHTAGQAETGFRIFDVWESRQAFERFMEEQLMPAAEALGIPQGEGPGPQIYELDVVSQSQKARV